MTTKKVTPMKTEHLTVRVELPNQADADFEALMEHLAEAVYQRVKKRLEQDAKGAGGDINDA